MDKLGGDSLSLLLVNQIGLLEIIPKILGGGRTWLHYTGYRKEPQNYSSDTSKSIIKYLGGGQLSPQLALDS